YATWFRRPGSCDPCARRAEHRVSFPDMTPSDIRITAEPIDNGRCKFLVSEPVHAGGVRRFASRDEAQGSPLAEAIFAIPGADVELGQGIEASLHQHVPEVRGVVDITDHAAGSNPYFAAAKK